MEWLGCDHQRERRLYPKLLFFCCGTGRNECSYPGFSAVRQQFASVACISEAVNLFFLMQPYAPSLPEHAASSLGILFQKYSFASRSVLLRLLTYFKEPNKFLLCRIYRRMEINTCPCCKHFMQRPSYSYRRNPSQGIRDIART